MKSKKALAANNNFTEIQLVPFWNLLLKVAKSWAE
jgi:hypothetical protein